jgi:hypothetical protein
MWRTRSSQSLVTQDLKHFLNRNRFSIVIAERLPDGRMWQRFRMVLVYQA